MKFKSKDKPPCSCGHNKWKTKGNREDMLVTEYSCRACGDIRQITRAMNFAGA